MAKAADMELKQRTIEDLQQRGKIHLRGRDPRKSFFMALSVGNLDGSVEDMQNSAEGVEAITDTEAEAIEITTSINDSYPTIEFWVYRCVPVAKVWRGKTRVTRLK